jgi:hypothetical protein
MYDRMYLQIVSEVSYSLGLDHTENTSSCSCFVVVQSSCCSRPHTKQLFPQFLCCCVASVAAVTRCHMTFTGPFHNNGRFCWFHNFGCETSYHDILFVQGLVFLPPPPPKRVPVSLFSCCQNVSLYMLDPPVSEKRIAKRRFEL